jgi:hypothetical protein
VEAGENFLKLLVTQYASSLTKLSFVRCTVPIELLRWICKKLIVLERMDIPLPVKDLVRLPPDLR